MIRAACTVFCEKVVTTALNQRFAMAIYPGAVFFNAAPGTPIRFSAYVGLTRDQVGECTLEGRFTTPDGQVVDMFRDLKVRFNVIDEHAQFDISDVSFPVSKTGTFRLELREAGDEWSEAGTLLIRIPEVAPAGVGLDKSAPQGHVVKH